MGEVVQKSTIVGVFLLQSLSDYQSLHPLCQLPLFFSLNYGTKQAFGFFFQYSSRGTQQANRQPECQKDTVRILPVSKMILAVSL